MLLCVGASLSNELKIQATKCNQSCILFNVSEEINTEAVLDWKRFFAFEWSSKLDLFSVISAIKSCDSVKILLDDKIKFSYLVFVGFFIFTFYAMCCLASYA